MSSSSRSTEVDEEEKYWKLKLLNSALSSVLFRDSPDPRLTPEVLSHLRKVFHDPDAHADSSGAMANVLITAEVKAAIQDCVVLEIQGICDTLVSTLTDLLKNSNSPEDKDRLLAITNSANPIDEVLKHIEGQRQYESDLDKKILEAMQIKAGEIQELEDNLTKIKPTVEKVLKLAASSRQPERINRRVEYLQRKSDFLARKTEEARNEQIALENPPEIISLRRDVKNKLALAKEKLKSENQCLSEFFQKYDNLDPDLKALLNQLQSTEEAIERQQWILNRMRGFKESDDSFGAEAETFF
ncbi:unnamed protein product [Allacma fusca]|uniref:Uncharacterized protein n=1 Tax=Allacma fusca TaxID=39272 RepID=A0A8J2LUK4_9HEXA|nr:unnamed protein product [Allacma fusca]